MASLEELRYPIGPYRPPSEISRKHIEQWIDTLSDFPHRISQITTSMQSDQLDTPYRPDGWTVRQLVHHIADSHLNSYIRFKWAKTEENPTIKTYDQDDWGDQADCRKAPVELSLKLIEALHARWVFYLRTFSDEDFSRTFYHPEMQREIRLDWLLGMYAWHCDHHYAHIAGLVSRQGW